MAVAWLTLSETLLELSDSTHASSKDAQSICKRVLMASQPPIGPDTLFGAAFQRVNNDYLQTLASGKETQIDATATPANPTELDSS